ncbi:MAG: hypothetical protein ACJASC_003370 [Limimaricola cinnabarinus]|jgi:hypothetical protein
MTYAVGGDGIWANDSLRNARSGASTWGVVSTPCSRWNASVSSRVFRWWSSTVCEPLTLEQILRFEPVGAEMVGHDPPVELRRLLALIQCIWDFL